jgi:hypothetical protein
VLTVLPLESSGNQCQGIKLPRQYPNFSASFLGDTQMLVHILQGVKASAKRGLKLLAIEVITIMVCKDYEGVT